MHEQNPQWIQNSFCFGNQGTESPTSNESLSQIITWLIPVVGDSDKKFLKSAKSITCSIATDFHLHFHSKAPLYALESCNQAIIYF